MSISILDANVLVTLAQTASLDALQRLSLPPATTDIVDGEVTVDPVKHPNTLHYIAARDAGKIAVYPLIVGSAAYREYLRLRRRRTAPKKNRGEDSCVALALVTPGSVIYLDDGRGQRMAIRELGTPSRVFTSADI